MNPVIVINGVDIFTQSRWEDNLLGDIQFRGLAQISITNGDIYLRDSDTFRRKFPDVFPPDEKHVAIRRAIYDRVLDMWQHNPYERDYHESMLLYIQNPGYDLQVSDNDIIGKSRELYQDLLPPNIRKKYGSSFDRRYQKLQNDINMIYEQEGYEYYYFGWINTENQYYRAKKGEIPLRPDTFEIGTFLKLYPSQYREALKYIKIGIYPQCQNQKDRLYSSNFLGWKKSDIQQAILKSGLIESEPYKSDPTLFRKGIKWTSLGINRKGFATNLSKRVYSHYPYASMKSCYWDTIYRKFFNTASFINWPYLCSNRFIDYNTLKKIAVEDFGLNYNKVKAMKYGQICQVYLNV